MIIDCDKGGNIKPISVNNLAKQIPDTLIARLNASLEKSVVSDFITDRAETHVGV